MIRTAVSEEPRPAMRVSLTELFLYAVAIMVVVPGYPSLYKLLELGVIALIIRAVRRHQRRQ